MKKTKPLYHGHRFPASIISCAARSLSIELARHRRVALRAGLDVKYETIRCRCDKFGAGLARRVKAARRKPGSAWHLDEMCVTLRGEPYLLWRAVDEHGTELDILLQKRRDEAAAKRFFRRVLRSTLVRRKIVTDQLRSYPAAKGDVPGLASVKHVFVKAAARLNNRAGTATIRPGNASAACAAFATRNSQQFRSCFGAIRQHFAVKRHLLRASLYRKQLAARFVAWREFTE